MKIFSRVTEASVVGLFSILFAGYAVFIYPFEKARDMMNPAAREKQMKYAPKLTKA